MNPRRQPSIPPRIPGFEYVGLLGMGGFADVFEYTQDFPRRPVAVKVLLSSSMDQLSQEAFFAEANIMAGLSQHPSIVAIHQAAIASDGRPYFVMEYCAKPSLGARYRSERISVAEVLRTGIRVASAVETAHRSGVLHRDIKPANILATDFGWPALTDFGIAGAMGDQMVAQGMSIPWAPPELLGEAPVGDARSDVYSLAATLYTLLAGKSPFEVRGKSNSPLDLIARIESQAPPAIDRVDVPQELNSILARGMQKNPTLRFSSALAFAHALQQIERKMQLPVTGIDVPELADLDLPNPVSPSLAPAPVPEQPLQDNDDQTKLRPITTISAQGSPDPVAEEAKETRLRPITSIPVQTTVQTATPGTAQSAGPAPARTAVTSPGTSPIPGPVPPPGPNTMRPHLAEPKQFWAEETTDPGYFKALRKKSEEKSSKSGRSMRALVSIMSVVVLLAVLFFIGKNVLGSDNKQREENQDVFQETPNRPDDIVPGVISLTSSRSAERTVTFTWQNPAPAKGDAYMWRVVDVGANSTPERITETQVDVPLAADKESVCIEVSLVRENGKASNTPTRGCS